MNNTDERQNKVLKRINYNGGSNNNLHDARRAKNDEFYTPFDVIMQELDHWKDKLKGKDIICPCDNDVLDGVNCVKITFEPYTGRASKYVLINSQIKTLECYKAENFFSDKEKNEVETIDFLTKEAAMLRITEGSKCNFVNALIKLGEEVGVNSITASGYDPEAGKGIKFQDVDYSKYDICITNPPFSIYGEFMDIMVAESNKRKGTEKPFDFIVLAPFSKRPHPCVGLHLMLKEVFLGYGRHITTPFVLKGEKSKYKSVACDWITTFDDAQRELDEKFVPNYIDYELYKNDFKVMKSMTMRDGTHPIKIPGTILPDYDGWMFAPITVIDTLPMDKYEWYGTNFHSYFNKVNVEANPFSHNITDDMLDGGYDGFVFRRKQTS